MTLLGPGAKDQQTAYQVALSAAIRHLQAAALEAASIQLWLLVNYAPALQIVALRYRKPCARLEESESSVVVAFLETLHALGEKRLVDPCLALEVLRDAQRRLTYYQGMLTSNHAARVAATPDKSLMADCLLTQTWLLPTSSGPPRPNQLLLFRRASIAEFEPGRIRQSEIISMSGMDFHLVKRVISQGRLRVKVALK